MSNDNYTVAALEAFCAKHSYNYSVSKNEDDRYTVRLSARGDQIESSVIYSSDLQAGIASCIEDAELKLANAVALRPKLYLIFQHRVEGVWTSIGHYQSSDEIATDKDLFALGAVRGQSTLPDNGVPDGFDVELFPEGTERINWQFIAGLVTSDATGVAFDPDFTQQLLEMYQAGARRIVYGFHYPQERQ